MYELSLRLRREIQTRDLLQRRCNTLATVFQTMQIAEQCEETITYEAMEFEVILNFYNNRKTQILFLGFRKLATKWTRNLR